MPYVKVQIWHSTIIGRSQLNSQAAEKKTTGPCNTKKSKKTIGRCKKKIKQEMEKQ